MQISYNNELIVLYFTNEADPEIVELAKAIVDRQAPGLRLRVSENITPYPVDIVPIPQNVD